MFRELELAKQSISKEIDAEILRIKWAQNDEEKSYIISSVMSDINNLKKSVKDITKLLNMYTRKINKKNNFIKHT